MFKNEMLLDILTPDIIEQLGMDSILSIKKAGRENHYLVTIHTNNPYYDHPLDYSAQRAYELSKTPLASSFSNEGRILFCSEIKFCDDQNIIELLKKHDITKENLEIMNERIKSCQRSHIQYTMQSIKLENEYDLKVDQVERIIKIPKKLIVSTLLKINNQGSIKETLKTNKKMITYDLNLFDKATSFYDKLKDFEEEKKNCLEELQKDITLRKLIIVGRNFFGLQIKDLSLLINKINELLIICPDKVMCEKQSDQSKVKVNHIYSKKSQNKF